MGSAGEPVNSAGRYLAGLCVAALGLCAGGWLVLTPFAFGYPGHGRAAVTALATGGGLVVVCAVSAFCWATLWRRKLRADGVLLVPESRRSRRSAKRHARAERLVRASRQRELAAAPELAQVLNDLRGLLTPLLANGNPDGGAVDIVPPPATGAHDMEHAAPVEATDVEPVEATEVEPDAPSEENWPHEDHPHEDSRHEETGQIPGHLRGTRSESFFANAELLMVGSGEQGEEESW